MDGLKKVNAMLVFLDTEFTDFTALSRQPGQATQEAHRLGAPDGQAGQPLAVGVGLPSMCHF